MSINWWMNQYNVHSYSGTLLSNKTEQTTDTCHNTEESPQSVMVNEGHRTERTPYCIVWFHWQETLDQENWTNRKQISCCQGLGVRGRHWLERDTRAFWRVMDVFSVIISLVLIWMGTFVKTQQIVHLKLVPFIQCKLYLKFKSKREHLRSCFPAYVSLFQINS